MNNSLLRFCSVSALLSHLACAGEGQTMIEDYLRQEAVRLEARFLQDLQTREQWERRRPELRREYLEMLGLWPVPERTPLEAKVTSQLERPAGFRVENLHFQSRPHLYVTGNLYLPQDAAPGAKLPAVLYVCGHSGRGRDGNKTAFQHHGMWFATHGYVCLMIDSLQLGEIAGIHHGTYRYDRWWWLARGYTPAGVECWNGIRALDYLQSRPEVDPERLAVTGISGGGAATFWIAAADERVRVAVPVSGMSDLEDYVGAKVVNGHCDCMFLHNAFHWPWTQIAALIAPRPLLFQNSGHDPIFPMDGNDRIRARLERLYRFYTNRTERLFDIGVTPGGHNDNPELRLMAYRWIDWHLKGTNAPVTEPQLPPLEGKALRAFPDDLPADEVNSKIDELFVPTAAHAWPQNPGEYAAWREDRLSELKRLVFRPLADPVALLRPLEVGGAPDAVESGWLETEPGLRLRWTYFPAGDPKTAQTPWLIVLGEGDSAETKPNWVTKVAGNAATLLVAPRGTGPLGWSDPAPFYIQRALALLGGTVDSGRLTDVRHATRQMVVAGPRRADGHWMLAGRGPAGVIAAYAALFEPGVAEVVLVDPPASHLEGPVFLNVLRVLDIPEALGMLAPRPVTVYTYQPDAFDRTRKLHSAAGIGSTCTIRPRF
jgi:dienelactone hydrolase